jgi:hypothetical protein
MDSDISFKRITSGGSGECPSETGPGNCAIGYDEYETTCYIPGVSAFERLAIRNSHAWPHESVACRCKFFCDGSFDGLDCGVPAYTTTWTE